MQNALHLTSIAKETVQLKHTVIENCQVQIDETRATNDFNFELSKILNETATKMTDGCKHSDFYDYRTILNGQEPKTISNNVELRAYVNGTLDWKFFKGIDDLTVQENIWRVRLLH
jgi:hypothetical protein